VPADRRPPGSPARRRTRRAAAEPGSPPGTLERMWALVLRRFRNHLHDTDTLEQNPTKDDDERT
jgi:hypothetical protein